MRAGGPDGPTEPYVKRGRGMQGRTPLWWHGAKPSGAKRCRAHVWGRPEFVVWRVRKRRCRIDAWTIPFYPAGHLTEACS